mmetsp:Transcript_6/g.6  ORF Transcript_6/g.6 Transcript_6/m.6 type:complete len:106 (-) Transcript_6:375-692(-)
MCILPKIISSMGFMFMTLLLLPNWRSIQEPISSRYKQADDSRYGYLTPKSIWLLIFIWFCDWAVKRFQIYPFHSIPLFSSWSNSGPRTVSSLSESMGVSPGGEER